MADFSTRDYENEVLKPLRKQLPHLSTDLLTRYAVSLDMSESDMAGRVKAVVAHWNKVAMRPGQLAVVCQQLQREHQSLKAEPNAFTPAWWPQKAAQRSQELGPEIAALAGYLKATYGPLEKITWTRLRAEASDALGDAERRQACGDAGLTIVDTVDLPTAAGTRGQYASFENDLVATGARSIVELVHPELTGFGLVGGVSVTPTPTRAALSSSALSDRVAETEKLPDSTEVRARKTALGFLRTEQTAGTDLTALALFHLLAPVRARRAAGVSGPQPLYALLTSTGLADADAARIVLSVLEETAVARDPGAEVAELLGQGLLEAARQAATALPGEPGTTAREAVERQHHHVEDLRRRARESRAAGDDQQAGDLLREAAGLASDREAVAAELADVPPAPVRSLSAASEGSGVRLSWQAPRGQEGTTEFRVVRKNDRPPTDVDDGDPTTVRARGDGGGHATLDETPPVGRPLHYAVFARAGTGPWSRPAFAAVEVLPAVTDVVVGGDESAVTAQWRVHPDVAGVEVTRSTGGSHPSTRIPVQRTTSFRDDDVVDGVRYHYTIVPSYLTPTGMQTGPTVVLRGATRPRAQPIPELTAHAEDAAHGMAIQLSWRQRPGNDVVVRRATRPCPWEYGETVARTDLDRYGDELVGTRTEQGDQITLVAPAPLGRSHCVPFTLGADGAVRGADAVVDLSEPIRRLQAQRFGEDIRITWSWPDEISTAEVAWPGGRRRITRQQYRDAGGCRVHGLRDAAQVEVRPVLPGTDGEGTEGAPAAAVRVEALPPRLRYEIRRRGHKLLGGVKCTVTVSADTAVDAQTLLLVASDAPVMPLRPGDGHLLHREPLRLGPGAPQVLPEVAVPGHLHKPYWLRCFLVEPANAQLDDPPTSQLKVS